MVTLHQGHDSLIESISICAYMVKPRRRSLKFSLLALFIMYVRVCIYMYIHVNVYVCIQVYRERERERFV